MRVLLLILRCACGRGEAPGVLRARCPLAARRALLVLLLACFRVLWSVKKVFHMKIYLHLPSLLS